MDNLSLYILLFIGFSLTNLDRNLIHSNLRLLQRLLQPIKNDLFTLLALVLIRLVFRWCTLIRNQGVTDTCLVQLMIAVFHLHSKGFVLNFHVAFEAGVKISIWLFEFFLERKGTEVAQ